MVTSGTTSVWRAAGSKGDRGKSDDPILLTVSTDDWPKGERER
jgi:hypothetical protein